MRRLLLLLSLALPVFGAISPAAIRAHIQFLASDLLEGRRTGTRGYDLAADYVEAQFAAAGLLPAGDNRTFRQAVRARTGVIIADKCSMTVDGTPLMHRKDIIFRPNLVDPVTDVDGEIVFAGYGITAPELQYDDYANLDVKGKIVLILSGAPPRFPSDQRAFYSDRANKVALAGKRGAIAVLGASTRVDERRFPFDRAVKQADMNAMSEIIDGVVAEVTPQIRASVGLGPATAAALFKNAPMTFEQVLDDAEKSISRAFPLAVRAVIHQETKQDEITTSNVAGRISGSSHPNEHVAITAHLDHLGSSGSGVDRIYNGALDNASGIASLIEIARAIASGPRPARSIVFVAFAGEELGGIGAGTFTARPPVPSLVADVNMDMFTMLFPVADVVPLGADHSTLGDLVGAAASKAGFTTSPDPQPEEVRFIRSDQYAFVKRGIPAMIFKPGFKSSDPAIDGEKITRDWLRAVYHTVNDNPDQKLDYPSGARWAEANMNLVLTIANAKERPRWKAGDFFGEKFGKR